MPSATDVKLGWMDWPCPYKRISKFNNPVNDTSETYDYDLPMDDVIDVGNRIDAPTSKKHAACDECRKRKLKCSGEVKACSRCRKHNLDCHYSEQKQMGRPRKRRRDHDNPPELLSEKQVQSISPSVPSIPLPIQPYDALDNVGLQSFASYSPATPGPMTPLPLNFFEGSLQSSSDSLDQVNGAFEQSLDSVSDEPSLYNPNSTSPPIDAMLSWPDFSTAVSPYPVHPTLTQQYPIQDIPISQVPTPRAPQCSCLPTLYLTLSSLQTMIPSFPGSMMSLRAATSTAVSVLWCPTCPSSFSAALQNVMLLGTLLPVLLSTYNQILHLVDVPESVPAEQRTVTVGESSAGLVDFDDLLIGIVGAEHPWGAQVEIPAPQWADLCRRVIRREIYGTDEDEIPASGQEKGGVMGLVNEMEARQHSWHGRLAKGHTPKDYPLSNHHPPVNIETCSGHIKVDEKEALCLRIVSNVRKVAAAMGLDSLGKEAEWYKKLGEE